MEVSVWVPIGVAAVAAIPAWYAARNARRSSSEDRRVRELELALSGFVSLFNEVQEERADLREQLAECVRARRALEQAT
jgi:type II secretory pathway pseudopilin PulG